MSDWIVIVICSPPGPLPKKAGFVLVTTSPSFRLSRITLVGEGDEVTRGRENFDSFVALSGKFKLALGI